MGSQDNLRDSRGALMTTGKRPLSRANTHDSMSSHGLMAPESEGHISLGRALHMGTDEADELLGKVGATSLPIPLAFDNVTGSYQLIACKCKFRRASMLPDGALILVVLLMRASVALFCDICYMLGYMLAAQPPSGI